MNWAIITGEQDWGDTFFKMEMEYDTGVIYAQEFFCIEPYDDVKTVYDKVAHASVTALEKHLVDWTEGILDGREQEGKNATHYPRRKPSDGLLDLRKPATEIYNAIRGQTRPYPGAFIEMGSRDGKKKVYIWKARLGEDMKSYEAGIVCGDGDLLIAIRVQEEGEPEMWAGDYASLHPGFFQIYR